MFARDSGAASPVAVRGLRPVSVAQGSAVHIDRFARALFEHAGGGLLYVLGGDELPAYQREGSVEVVRYMREAEHVLEGAAGYGERLATLLERLPDLRIAHFRDPWS